jgi:tetratricopeptide (TPR) repeat protein
MKNITALTFLFVFMFVFCTNNSFAQNRKALKFQNKAQEHYAQKEYELAIEDFDKALKKGEPNFEILFFKGISYFHLGQYENAITNYDLAIKINPRNYNPYYRKGRVYQELKDYENAIMQFRRALKYAPKEKHAFIYSYIGGCFLDVGQHQECIKAYNAAVQLEEGVYYHYYNLAKGYSAMGNFKKAIEINKTTIRINPKAKDAYNNMGMNYLMIKDYRNAIKMLKKALELEDINALQDKAYPYNNLAFCYLNINMLDKAIEYAEKSKALDNKNSYVYFTFAGIAAFKKDHEEFYNQLIKAHELGFPLETRLDELFLKPYLEEERFKSFLK